MVLTSAPARPLYEILDMLLASPLSDSKLEPGPAPLDQGAAGWRRIRSR